jgi:hypothetical protein
MSEAVVLSPERHKLLVSLKAAGAIRGEEWQDVSSTDPRVLRGLEKLDFILLTQVEGKTKARIMGRGSVALRSAIVHGTPEYGKYLREKDKVASAEVGAASEQISSPEPVVEDKEGRSGDFDAEFATPPFEAKLGAKAKGQEVEDNKVLSSAVKADACEPGCAAPCAYRRVLEMLMERNPKVRELLDHAIRLEQLLESFDAE